MRVRSFEIADGDIRQLHDYLLEVGGFTFRAGGSKFFVLIGERFFAAQSATQAHMVLAQSEAGIVSIDVIAAGGGDTAEQSAEVLSDPELWFLTRATELLRGFAERHGAELVDI